MTAAATLPAAVHARAASPIALVTVCGHSTATAPIGLLSTRDAERVTCPACLEGLDLASERALEAVASAGVDAWESDRETGALDDFSSTWEIDAVFYGGAVELETAHLSTPALRGNVIRAVAAVPDLRAAWREAFDRGYRAACVAYVAEYRRRQAE